MARTAACTLVQAPFVAAASAAPTRRHPSCRRLPPPAHRPCGAQTRSPSSTPPAVGARRHRLPHDASHRPYHRRHGSRSPVTDPAVPDGRTHDARRSRRQRSRRGTTRPLGSPPVVRHPVRQAKAKKPRFAPHPQAATRGRGRTPPAPSRRPRPHGAGPCARQHAGPSSRRRKAKSPRLAPPAAAARGRGRSGRRQQPPWWSRPIRTGRTRGRRRPRRPPPIPPLPWPPPRQGQEAEARPHPQQLRRRQPQQVAVAGATASRPRSAPDPTDPVPRRTGADRRDAEGQGQFRPDPPAQLLTAGGRNRRRRWRPRSPPVGAAGDYRQTAADPADRPAPPPSARSTR